MNYQELSRISKLSQKKNPTQNLNLIHHQERLILLIAAYTVYSVEVQINRQKKLKTMNVFYSR